MTGTYRERVFSCPRDRTYKYYLPKEDAQPAWERLREEFGAPSPGACGVLVLRGCSCGRLRGATRSP